MDVAVTTGAVRYAKLQSYVTPTNHHPAFYKIVSCLTLPYGEGVLPPSAEASGGPNAHNSELHLT